MCGSGDIHRPREDWVGCKLVSPGFFPSPTVVAAIFPSSLNWLPMTLPDFFWTLQEFQARISVLFPRETAALGFREILFQSANFKLAGRCQIETSIRLVIPGRKLAALLQLATSPQGEWLSTFPATDASDCDETVVSRSIPAVGRQLI